MVNSAKCIKGQSEPSDGTTPREPVGTIRQASARTTSEVELFETGPGPRLFGEGSYLEGGSLAEGNYALPDSNPRGGYGSFGDAGGLGSAELLGEEEPASTGSTAGGALAAGTDVSAPGEGKATQKCSEEPAAPSQAT